MSFYECEKCGGISGVTACCTNAVKHIEAVTVEICKTAVWVENDLFGGRHIVVQHEGHEPFTYASFNYDYRYTSNASTLSAAQQMAISLGAKEPIEFRTRELKPFSYSREELAEQIKILQQLHDSLQ